MLIFLVDVDDHCKGDRLEHLLLMLKGWGDDKKLAKAIVVLSSPRSALTLELGATGTLFSCARPNQTGV